MRFCGSARDSLRARRWEPGTKRPAATLVQSACRRTGAAKDQVVLLVRTPRNQGTLIYELYDSETARKH